MIEILQQELKDWSKEFILIFHNNLFDLFYLFFYTIFRTHLKAQETERVKLLALKDSYEKKESEWNKESSQLRGQVIELTESIVC